MTSVVKRNEVIKAKIQDLSYEGLGVAKVDGVVVFVKGALPSEEVTIRISKVEKRFAYAELLSIEKKSKDRVEVENPLLTSTMPLQHLAYEKQVAYKTKLVKDLFQKSALLKDVVVNDTVACAHPFHYRNKTQVPVRLEDKQFISGIFSAKTKRVVAVDDFKLNLPGMDELVKRIREILIEFNEKPYHEVSHTGNIRHIVVRKSEYYDEYMVIIVTRSKSLFPTSKIIPAIVEACPNVVSIVQNINGEKSSAIFGEVSKVIYGKGYYREKLLENTFEVTPLSFLQVNTKQAEVLYEKAIEILKLTGTETVLDAYCGIGTITLALAKHAKKVVGIEILEEAVEVARHNALQNKVTNVSFESGSVESVVENLDTHFDCVVVDPPRNGLEKAFIEYVIKEQMEKVVYISCNPATLVRDLELFASAGYVVGDVTPVDLFPQTTQVETVVLMSRVEK
ncbi:MAG: 23S rRNA (uracil(1939)-C(5))-methyltransferase RlmD [Erysipelotrichaceae bacterium]